MRDWRGTPIEVGSRIVYPVSRGSFLLVFEAEVVTVHEDGPPGLFVRRVRESTAGGGYRALTDFSYARLTRVDRVTVVA